MLQTKEEFVARVYKERSRRNRMKQLMRDRITARNRMRIIKFKATGRGRYI